MIKIWEEQLAKKPRYFWKLVDDEEQPGRILLAVVDEEGVVNGCGYILGITAEGFLETYPGVDEQLVNEVGLKVDPQRRIRFKYEN